MLPLHILKDLANERQELDLLDTSEFYIDATFANGRGGGLEIGNEKCGKGVNIMAIVDRTSLSLSKKRGRYQKKPSVLHFEFKSQSISRA